MSVLDDAATGCPLLTRARALAGFVGEGRPVTAKAVLSRADIATACSAARLPDPGRVVTAAHVPTLHRAWIAAQAAGLVEVGLREARAGTPVEGPLEQWRSAVAAVLRAESDDGYPGGATIVVRVALDVLADQPGASRRRFTDALSQALQRLPLAERIDIPYTFRRGVLPEEGALEVLAECGAVDADRRTVTPLGRQLRLDLTRPPAPARPRWADEDTLQLRIDLDRFRPPVWRRLRLPASSTLADLHRIIQIIFEWDDDHLHIFTVDGVHYSDAWDRLDDCSPADELTLAVALPRPGARLSYRYDLGDCWDHTVLLEAGHPRSPRERPTCVDGRGNAPVEDWSEEEAPPPRQLDLAVLDRRLARLRIGR